MKADSQNYRAGLFILLTLALLIVFIILFGSGKLFTHYVTAESYFNESVQGLTVGSPVKFRGVTIGKVTEIELLGLKYDTNYKTHRQDASYIYVQFEVSPKIPDLYNKQSAQNVLSQAIKDGLRIKLATQDLVGNVYLELNFMNAKKNPGMALHWTPKYIYIPSAKSTLTRLTDTIETMVNQFNNINDSLIPNINTLVESTIKTLQAFQPQAVSTQTITTLKSLKHAADSINQSAISLNTHITSYQSKQLMHNLYLSSIDLKKSTKELTASLRSFNQLMTGIHRQQSNQQQNIAAAFDNMRQSSQALNTLSSNLSLNPSQIIFGQTPSTLDPNHL
jgi:paraquat-inducible protein B